MQMENRQEIRIDLSCTKCGRESVMVEPPTKRLSLRCQFCGADYGSVGPVAGYVYALSNEAMPGLLKIGFTTRMVADRVAELNASTATPVPFRIAFSFAANEPKRDEKIVHAALADHRVNQGREFFEIEMLSAYEIVRDQLGIQESYIGPDLKSRIEKKVAAEEALAKRAEADKERARRRSAANAKRALERKRQERQRADGTKRKGLNLAKARGLQTETQRDRAANLTQLKAWLAKDSGKTVNERLSEANDATKEKAEELARELGWSAEEVYRWMK